MGEPLAPRPLALLAELTHACPLRCPYCSNPPEIPGRSRPLDADTWARALIEAAEMGVLQCSFSGGEPLLFSHLDRLVAVARREGMYTNLITSGVGLDAERARRLKEAGLDNVQISLQADEPGRGDEIAGVRVHGRKLAAARSVREAGMNLSLNVVLHRLSIDRLPGLLDLAAEMGATRIELAHVQVYGWAFENRGCLLLSPEEIQFADERVAEARTRLRGLMEILYVRSDYHDARPKACMGGWASRYLTIDPDGFALPCPTARSIPGMIFPNVREMALRAIWTESETFNRFRGTRWMREPCASCQLRHVDHGGCRCQAALITGDPANADPVCGRSPHRSLVEGLIRRSAGKADLLFRTAPRRTGEVAQA